MSPTSSRTHIPETPTNCELKTPSAATSKREEEECSADAGGGKEDLPRRLWRAIRWVGSFLLAQWFIIGIGLVILLAHFFPNVGRSGGVIVAQYTIKYLLVAIIFFIAGLTLPLNALAARTKDWRLHLVTNLTSFFLFPALVFGVVSAVRAADPDGRRINEWALVGMVVMGCLPTTVSSNVIMTGQAGGDQSAAIIEVLIGNLVGTFLSPALLQMFLSSPKWAFGRPQASGPGGIGEIYRQVIEQLGFTVLIPMFVGEVILWWQPVFVKKWRVKLKLGKLSSLCLLGVIWSTFCNSFYSGSFERLNGGTITLVLLTNIGFYIFFCLFLYLIARVIPMPHWLVSPSNRPSSHYTQHQPQHDDIITSSHWEERMLFDSQTTIALLFCGPAKGIVLGSPIVQILYGGVAPLDRGIITIPVVLFQGSQVVLGQLTVAILRSWARRVAAKTERLRSEDNPVKDSLEGTEEKMDGSGNGVDEERQGGKVVSLPGG